MRNIFIAMAFVATLFAAGCAEDTPALPDNLISFETNTVGVDESETSKTITLQLSRAVDAATNISIGFVGSNTTYGSDYTTEPAATDNTIALTLPTGATSISFTIIKAQGIYFDGDESIDFSVALADETLVLGEQCTLKVAFASIVSEGSSMTLQGGEGGSSAVNSVFVDFSNNAQSSVLRKSWDLGFYCGDDFRVILNNTVGASAIAIDKTDLAQVTAADTASLNLVVASSNTNALNIIDNVSGDLTKTVFGNISSVDAENKVFIVSRGALGGVAARAWKKVRVLRTATGYTVQHANITETTFQTINIDKDATANFKYLNFDNGAVAVQPAKAKWDIMWTGCVYTTTSNGVLVPYYYSDMVFINHLAGVTVAEAVYADADATKAAYNNLTTIETEALVYSSNMDFIGANWRVSRATATEATGVRTNRFYVVKDAAGNIYKLRFMSFGVGDGGTRGYPVIEYALVKKAE
jgi:hypothetical protein